MGQLHRRCAYAASRGMDQHSLPHLETSPVEQRVIRGKIYLRGRGSLYEVPASGDRNGHAVMGDGTAGVTASAQESKNAVSLRHADNPLTGLKNYSSEFQTGDV